MLEERMKTSYVCDYLKLYSLTSSQLELLATSNACGKVHRNQFVAGVCIHWTGLLDWTRLTFELTFERFSF